MQRGARPPARSGNACKRGERGDGQGDVRRRGRHCRARCPHRDPRRERGRGPGAAMHRGALGRGAASGAAAEGGGGRRVVGRSAGWRGPGCRGRRERRVPAGPWPAGDPDLPNTAGAQPLVGLPWSAAGARARLFRAAGRLCPRAANRPMRSRSSRQAARLCSPHSIPPLPRSHCTGG